MRTLNDVIQGAAGAAKRHLLDEVLGDYPERDFQVRMWDGTAWGAAEHPRFSLVLNHPSALRSLFSGPSRLSLGEAYIYGDFDVEGDISAAFRLGQYLLNRYGEGKTGHSLGLAAFEKLSAQPSFSDGRGAELEGTVHSRERDAQAIRYHYDCSPEFFALWLDRNMMYSSAYFAAEDEDLDTAQTRKLDYICRKLRLRKGDSLLDIGCGWGGLLIHAARHYGALAHGITLSLRQAGTARNRIHAVGLDHRCRVEVCDYRDLECDQPFDKIASIGMFEHVGEALLPEYFRRAWELVRPGGLFLNSGITSVPSYPQPSDPSFIDHYVFPDGELLPLSTIIAAAESGGFEVRDVEGLRQHYALTLREWVRRLEARAVEARRITDDTTYRIWRLYMAGSEQQFREGTLNVYQILLSKANNGNSTAPADWREGRGR
jgi:cyclopropane-fatty-acyl-phospholipid synthase